MEWLIATLAVFCIGAISIGLGYLLAEVMLHTDRQKGTHERVVRDGCKTHAERPK